MKKIMFIFLVFFSCLGLLSLSGCKEDNNLLFLNWGEYISDDVVKAFEEEYNCTVTIDIADSNELFYSKIKSGTTAYDLVCPSDYMVKKMVQNDLLQTIDKSRLNNFNYDNLLPGVQGILETLSNNSDVNYLDYVCPYLWGTFGLMYNKQKEGLEEAVTTYGWEAYYNDDLLPDKTRVGMYDVPLFAYAAGAFLHNANNAITESESAMEEVRNTLNSRKYSAWGTDTLKKDIAKGDLDLAFVYTGDCLDMLYQQFSLGKTKDTVTFDIYIPDNTIAFLDSLVLTKKARHVDLAYKFMDFMLETENAKMNASVIGYCTPLLSTYNAIVGSTNEDEADWAYAVSKYYPLPKEGEKKYKGIPLTNFSKSYLTELTNMINNVKTK